MDEKEALYKGLLTYIGEDVDKEYIKNLKSLVIRKDLVKEKASDLKIIYTSIHGSGNKLVRRVLYELRFVNVKVVKEQENLDGNFPTTSYPNPEDKSVFKLALEMAKTENPDIIFGTDPDCDRIGVVVKDNCGDYKVLTGNQTDMILTDYILKSLKDEGKVSSKGAIIKTIVTTEGVKNIADFYRVELINTLTEFKYIDEK